MNFESITLAAESRCRASVALALYTWPGTWQGGVDHLAQGREARPPVGRIRRRGPPPAAPPWPSHDGGARGAGARARAPATTRHGA